MKKLLFITIFSFLCSGLYAQQAPARDSTTVKKHKGGKMKAAVHLTPKEDSIFRAKEVKKQAKYDSLGQIEFSKEVNNAQYIFEGTIIETKQSGKGYANQIVKIHKIFKGDLSCGTIKIIADGGNIKMDSAPEIDGEGYGRFEKGTSAVFFCRDYTSTDRIMVTDIKPNNQTALQINDMVYYYYGAGNSIGEEYIGYFDGDTRYPLGFSGSYQQIYNRLQKEPGTQFEKCDSMDFKKHDDSVAKAKKYKYEHGGHSYPTGKDTTKNKNSPNNINQPAKGQSAKAGSLAPPTLGPPTDPWHPDNIIYSIDSLVYDSLGKSIDFAVDISTQNPDALCFYSADIFLNINAAIGAEIKVI